MRIKVLALTQNPSAGGGAEKFLANLTIGLKDKVDFTLVYPSTQGTSRQPFPHQGRSIQLDLRWGNNERFSAVRLFRLLNRLRLLSDVIRAEKPDLILSNFSYTWHLLILLLKVFGLVRQPILLRFGNSIAHELGNRNRMYGWFLCRLISKADHLIANSHGLTKEFHTYFGVSPEKCSTINNPIPIERVISMSNLIKEEITREKKDNLILVHAGRLSPQKNQALLINVFGRLRNYLNVNLWIIGSGPCEQDLKQLAQKLNVSSAIRFWGWQDNPYPFLRSSDVFVLTSDYEGFPSILIEAMALGCPVVSTNCRYGPSEILESGAWGLLTPVGDEEKLFQVLLSILSNNDLRVQYSQKSIKRSKIYSEEFILPQYYELFSKLAEKPKP